MSSWLTQLSRKKKAKTRQLWEREFSIVEEGLDAEQVIAFVNDLIAHSNASQKATPDSVRAIIERAVTDAERIAASIKTRAQKEAEDEAAKIMTRAKQGAEEIRRQGETLTHKETEDVLAALNTKARLIEEEAKQKVETLLLQARQEIEKEVRAEYREVHSRLLRSLMKGAEEELPSADTQAPIKIQQKSGLVGEESKARLTAGEEAKKKAEEVKKTEAAKKQAEKEAKKKTAEAIEPEMPARVTKGKPAWQAKIGLGKKAKETKTAEETTKRAETATSPSNPDEAEKKKTEAIEPKMPARGGKERPAWLLKIGIGKKAKEAKTAKETVKQAESGAKLADAKDVKTEETKRTGVTQPQKEQEPNLPAAEGSAKKMVEKLAQTRKETSLPAPAESTAKRQLERPQPEVKPGTQEPAGLPQKLDRDAIYNGEIELAIAVPVDPAAVSKLYNYLQSTPDMKVLYTRGSWDRGTVITVSLDKPLPFIGMISRISGLAITPGLPQKENLVKGTSSSLLGAKRKETTKIDLILKAE